MNGDEFTDEFHVDEASARMAEDLTNSLVWQLAELAYEVGLEAEDTRFRAIVERADAPFRELPEQMPLGDVQTEAKEIGLLLIYAWSKRVNIPALRVEGEDEVVPLLPERSLLKPLLRGGEFYKGRLSTLFERFREEASSLDNVVKVNYFPVYESFISNLRSFLAMRIAGVRWAGRLPSGSAERMHLVDGGEAVEDSGGSGGFGGGGSPAGNAGVGVRQVWTVHTKMHGLSLYKGGTHAVRTHPDYLNAPTWPVNVSLPTGTLFLAADAGPGGKIVWDYTRITVPSPHPFFKTSVF